METRTSSIKSTLNRHHRRMLRHLTMVTAVTTTALLTAFCLTVFAPLFVRVAGGATMAREVQEIANRILFLHDHLWPLIGVSLLAVFLATWVVHMRMIGPLVRFVRIYDALTGGQSPTPITLRSTDYLVEETQALNGLVGHLRARSARLRALEADLLDVAAQAQESPETAPLGEQLRGMAKRLSEEIDGDRAD